MDTGATFTLYCKRMKIRGKKNMFIKIPKKIMDVLNPDVVKYVLMKLEVNRLIMIPLTYKMIVRFKFVNVPLKTHKISRVGSGVKTEYIVYIPKLYDVFDDSADVCFELACKYEDSVVCNPYIAVYRNVADESFGNL